MFSNNLLLGAVLILFALAIWLWANGLRRQTGLPEGDVIYTDTGTWFPNSDLLYAPEFRLVGKPDYLVQEPGGAVVPVELKSGQAPTEPWEGHVLQLAAYCLLVTEKYGRRPDYGILQYQNKAFAIDYTEELEEDLLNLLADMHGDLFEGELDRDHNDWNKCDRCGVRNHCYQRLA